MRRSPSGPTAVMKKTEKHTAWQPKAVRDMPSLKGTVLIKNTDRNHFTLDFLTTHFDASEWSPGYYLERQQPGRARRGFYIVDPNIDAYVPQMPGKHGAKLVPFCHDDDEDGPIEEYHDCPLFVASRTGERNMLTYLGHYSQTRFSDYLDHDTMSAHVSHECRLYWAKWLTALTRPDWVTLALKDHFWAQPAYEGSGDDLSLDKHAKDLREWLASSAEQVKLLRPQQILAAFEDAETADPPGLRLQWEYLQCVAYDNDFLNKLTIASSRASSNGSASDSATGWDIIGPSRDDYPITPPSGNDSGHASNGSQERQRTSSHGVKIVVDTTANGGNQWPLPGNAVAVNDILPRRQRESKDQVATNARAGSRPSGVRYAPPHRR